MSIVPSRSTSISLGGMFVFEATAKKHPTILDSYELHIEIPENFPKSIPTVIETGNKIPKTGNYHIYSKGELCLGSPLRLLSIIHSTPSLVKFAEKCIVPYLYAISIKLKYGGDLVFSELAHGGRGVIDDYLNLFCLQDKDQVICTLNLIAQKKRVANKKPCPCLCGNRLGKCKFNETVRRYRLMAPRLFFKEQAMLLSGK